MLFFNRLYYLSLVIFVFFFLTAKSQDSLNLELNFFVDTYYAYDFSNPENHIRQPFLYNHNRHNQWSINLGLISAKVEADRYYAKVGLMAGNYAADNLADEPVLLRSIWEANIGLALDQSAKWWVQVGVFPSHIGFESAISSQNFTYTRSLAAENSPYYLSGIKLDYYFNDQLSVSLLATNGWQQIERSSGDQNIGLGTQLNFNSTSGNTFNWSTYWANKHPREINITANRFFNNLYGSFPLSNSLQVIGGFDIGLQRNQNSANWESWFTAVLISQWKLSEKYALALRAEYYHDPKALNMELPNPALNYFSTFSASINFDTALVGNRLLWRNELRTFVSDENLFFDYNRLDYKKDNLFLISGLSFAF